MTRPALNLVVLRATDPGRTLAFYASLGLVFDLEQHEDGPEHHFSHVGSTVLEFYRATAETVPAPGSIGDVRLGFDVDNFNDTVAAAAALGTVVTPPTQRDGQLLAVLLDPDGRRVAITSRGGSPEVS